MEKIKKGTPFACLAAPCYGRGERGRQQGVRDCNFERAGKGADDVTSTCLHQGVAYKGAGGKRVTLWLGEQQNVLGSCVS